jgi:hypothetical protein
MFQPSGPTSASAVAIRLLRRIGDREPGEVQTDLLGESAFVGRPAGRHGGDQDIIEIQPDVTDR